MKFAFPDGKVFYRNLRKTYPQIVRGEGIYLYDISGRRYLDGSGGAVVVNIGHGIEAIADALAQQAKRVAYVNGKQFTNEPVETLSEELAEVMPESINKFYYLTSGSEATEASIKLARQYWVERGEKHKTKIISHNPGYHGNTLGALSVSGRPEVKDLYGPLLLNLPLIPAPVCYRCPCDKTYPSCGAVCAEALDAMIRQEGPETVSAFIAEPIIGASAGTAVPPPEYFKTIREICNHYRVLFIADEILTGMGRTGRWLAIEHYDILPDIVLLGKGLAGGYLPLSALAVREEIPITLENTSGAFLHGQTFSHTPMICTAGLAALRYLKAHHLVERSESMGKLLLERCRELLELDFVGDVRGKGLLVGIEFVSDRLSKKPFPRRARVAERIHHTALQNGLVVWIHSGHIDGESGDLVTIAPPFIINETQIDELIDLFSNTCRAVCGSL